MMNKIEKRIALVIIIVILCIDILVAFCNRSNMIDIYGEYPSDIIYVKTLDCDKLFSDNIGSSFILSFDIKANIEGKVLIYPFNGSDYKYYFEREIDVTKTYEHFDIEIKPMIVDRNVDGANIIFLGERDKKLIPIIKNLTLDLIY